MKYDIASKNIVTVWLETGPDCDLSEGEYTAKIIQVIGALDLTSPGGVDDPSLIMQCVENHIDEIVWEGTDPLTAEIRLIETGEREDNFWHKYYEIAK